MICARCTRQKVSSVDLPTKEHGFQAFKADISMSVLSNRDQFQRYSVNLSLNLREDKVAYYRHSMSKSESESYNDISHKNANLDEKLNTWRAVL